MTKEWFVGVNLRTGRMGIFPSAYAVDSDFSDWDSATEHGRRERYILGKLPAILFLTSQCKMASRFYFRLYGFSGNIGAQRHISGVPGS